MREASTVVMTGVSRGLGRIAAQRVVERRPDDHYVVLARSGSASLANELSASGARVIGIDCDLASLDDVRRAGAAITADLDAGTLPRLGGFLGNAGMVVTTTSSSTVDGFETIFAVNVLSHYLLLRLLLDRFTAPAWILLTSSDTHFGRGTGTPKPEWEGAERLAIPRPGGTNDGSRAYATSKLGDIYLAHALARRVPAGVDVFSYNPGLVTGTGLFRSAPRSMRFFLGAMNTVQRAIGMGNTAEKAGIRLAETILAPWPGPTGSYIDRGTAVPSSPESYDVQREDALWEDAARLIGL
jgi:NAD(P)-dependent dehydrogenase (short-subunit alcohol dehydrogenase family)